MTIEEIRKRKKELGWTNKELAERSGVSLSTLQKIMGNTTANPRVHTLYALENALKLDEAPATGYTIADYLALPEDVRVELIDGVFYDMASPSMRHQKLSLIISRLLDEFIERNGGSCEAFTAPADVQPDVEDDKTILQPDIFVVCDRDKIKNDRIYGAPDLVIEIASKSTIKKDQLVKKVKYINSGVREYWIVFPDTKKIVVEKYFIDDEDLEDPATTIYGFDDKVPVAIFDNKLKIDFAKIYKDVKFLYELEE